MRADWVVIVPFRAASAKSRFGPGDNAELAMAMALDTVAAALTVAHVIVVTDAAEPFVALGAAVHPDPGAGLNAAIAAGLEQAGVDTPRAVLLGDHPALTPTELAAALAAATHPLSLVADAAGDGSALTAARPGVPHALAFGPGSRAAHIAEGYVELDGDWPGLSADVDTAADLAGLADPGPRTSAWLASRS
ncbi:2-phospho-L-lactate guanylyltransferase [Salinibacterium sp. G-O1]|uniref:2-phospho-L-lactate guanylyltransferase n=1 Tax=Salinibacterium sp. G-O1 TaxID=3046208 RepID=UPI0024BA1EA5|nr:2-phospho-L-lactate guanylyltransferase [Salinibacterium sp. G-O1]MDJ0335744.1 2-phospho-L-lactate guanylyltransferase [Salinibacterium sp. G-O1]